MISEVPDDAGHREDSEKYAPLQAGNMPVRGETVSGVEITFTELRSGKQRFSHCQGS